MKRMLFNATHAEELRVAIVDGQKLLDLDIESAIKSERKGNIYKAVVTKVEPSLEAAFVNYGTEKHGFLPLKEIYRGYFRNYDSRTPMNNVKIDDVIKEGMEMIVQVDKDERGTKGAALTTFISLAGRFVVLMPNNPKGGGISRRISGEERAELRDALTGLKLEDDHAIIARTAGIGRSSEELQWDLDFLSKLWRSIEQAAKNRKAPFLIYQESNLIVRTIRDHLSADISEIIIDNEEIFERTQRFMNQVMSHNLTRLKFYNDTIPLFSRYQIENQIESAFNREVNLPSGGSIMIDHTEALISIDVNSAKATKGSDIEETAFQTNLEAVEEIARQLRIRDIGGLVVIDLIDMAVGKNQRSVENRLKDALKSDRARVQVGKISRFGLLEMSRQRLRSSISDSNYMSCPRCNGTGTIRSVVSSSLNLLRLIEDEALKENTEAIQVALPLDMATYLLNEKRHELNQLEARLASRVIIIPDDSLSSPHFELRRLRSEELDQLGKVPSYKQKVISEENKVDLTDSLKTPKPVKPSIEIDQIKHSTPPEVAPATAVAASGSAQPANRVSAESVGLLGRISRALFGSTNSVEKTQEKPEKTQQGKRQNNANRGRDDDDGRKPGQRGRGSRGGRGGRGGQQDGEQNRGKREGGDQAGNQQARGNNQNRGQNRRRGNDQNEQRENRGRGKSQNNNPSGDQRGKRQNQGQGGANTSATEFRNIEQGNNSDGQPRNQNQRDKRSQGGGNGRNQNRGRQQNRARNNQRNNANQDNQASQSVNEPMPTQVSDDIGNRKGSQPETPSEVNGNLRPAQKSNANQSQSPKSTNGKQGGNDQQPAPQEAQPNKPRPTTDNTQTKPAMPSNSGVSAEKPAVTAQPQAMPVSTSPSKPAKPATQT